jgi:hypothetical protein
MKDRTCGQISRGRKAHREKKSTVSYSDSVSKVWGSRRPSSGSCVVRSRGVGGQRADCKVGIFGWLG